MLTDDDLQQMTEIIRRHLDIPSSLERQMMRELVAHRGHISPEVRQSAFAMLTDDEIIAIEADCGSIFH